MKVCESFYHLEAKQILSKKKEVYSEFLQLLDDNDLKFGKTKPTEIRKGIFKKLNNAGWSDKVRIGKTNLTISFLRDEIGVCFQLGNVARTYADILKLNLLHKKGKIKVGVMVVADLLEAKKMGFNHANYRRLVQEVTLFGEIIQVPMIIIGLSN